MSKGPTARATAVNIPTTTKTAMVTCIPPKVYQDTPLTFVPNANPPITITGTFNITEGTGTTGLTISCANAQGTAVDLALTHINAAAGTPDNVSFTFVDSTGVETNGYTVSVQQTAATANGTVNQVCAWAMTDG